MTTPGPATTTPPVDPVERDADGQIVIRPPAVDWNALLPAPDPLTPVVVAGGTPPPNITDPDSTGDSGQEATP